MLKLQSWSGIEGSDLVSMMQDVRGRWNSLDSILAFGWCGSAVAGGFLLDAFGFDLTFLITAFFQVRIKALCHSETCNTWLP